MNSEKLIKYKVAATEYLNTYKSFIGAESKRSGLFFVKTFVDENLHYLLQIPQEFDPSLVQEIIDTNNLVVSISESLFREDDFSFFLRYVTNINEYMEYHERIQDIIENYWSLESTWTALTSLVAGNIFKEDLNKNYKLYNRNMILYKEYYEKYKKSY